MSIWDSLKNADRFTCWLAEFFGTFILVFVGCMGCVFHNHTTGRHHLEGALAFGFAVNMAVQCFAHISGSHVNPIISIAATICGQISLLELPFYIIFQCAGGIVGYLMVALMTPYYSRFGDIKGTVVRDAGVCATDINPKLATWQGFVIELTISFILILILCSVIDHRNEIMLESIPLRFGMSIATLGLVSAPFSSAHMNPARTLGPMLVNGYHNNHWVYWVAPTIGSVLGTIMYNTFWAEA